MRPPARAASGIRVAAIRACRWRLISKSVLAAIGLFIAGLRPSGRKGCPWETAIWRRWCSSRRKRLCWGLTKPDVRDLRHPVIPWVKHEDFRRLFEQGRNHLATDQINEEEWDFRTYFPSFLPAGGLWLDALGGDELAVKQQTLDLYHATHTLELANGGRIESFVYADGNVLAIRFRNLQGRKLRLRLSPEAVEPGRAGDDNSPKAQMIRREIFRRIQRQWLRVTGVVAGGLRRRQPDAADVGSSRRQAGNRRGGCRISHLPF